MTDRDVRPTEMAGIWKWFHDRALRPLLVIPIENDFLTIMGELDGECLLAIFIRPSEFV